MHILYIAPEIAIPGTHGGSTHVQEVAASLVRLGHHVTLLCRRSAQTPTAKGISYVRIPVFGGGLLRNLLYLIFTSMITKFYVLFKDVDLVIERGRIFAGIGILVAHFFKIPCAYEMIEPYTEVPLYTGKLSKRSLWYTFILRWHNHVVKKSTVTLVTHDSFLRTVPKNKALFVDTGIDPKEFISKTPCADIIKKYTKTTFDHLSNIIKKEDNREINLLVDEYSKKINKLFGGMSLIMKIKFWGVRGSIPVPGPTTSRYGGNIGL